MGATFFARLATDADAARRVAALLAESLDAYGAAVAAIEGEPSWTVEALFVREPDRTVVTGLVRVAAGDKAAAAIEFGTLEPKDWTAASRAALVPVRVGRFVLHGGHDRKAVAANEIGIEIEAALAFGTGHHGTTQGCLRAIERAAKQRRKRRTPSPRRAGRGERILDIGTGTGVLAIAAARVFRRPVMACDIDPVAVATARTNARANRAGAFPRIVQADGTNASAIRAGAPYDLVLANIVLGPLKLLAKPVARLLAPRAKVVLSGLLPEQANDAAAAWRRHGLRLSRRQEIEGWVTLTLVR